MKCLMCDFEIGNTVHMRSSIAIGRVLRGKIEPWEGSCGHIAVWREIADIKDAEAGKYKSFVSSDGNPIMATPVYVPETNEKNTNVVLATEKLPQVRRG